MSELVVAETRAWVERVVIGLRLCPFAAAAARVGDRLRYVVTETTDAESLLASLLDEMALLAATPAERIETTLLIHPHVLNDFDDYNDFLAVAEAALVELDLEGVLQIASFHPHYCFAGSAPDDIANATNRSPYPTLQLLREESIDGALAGIARPEAIYEANIATLQRLGSEGWAALQRQCREDAVAASGDGTADPA